MTIPRRPHAGKRPDPPADAALLSSMMRLGASSPRYIGHALALLRAASGDSPERQAERLGISTAALAHLSICPAPGHGGSAEELAAVARRIGIAAETLAAMLREARRLDGRHGEPGSEESLGGSG